MHHSEFKQKTKHCISGSIFFVHRWKISAFTLLELLVVVGLIAIFAIATIPAFNAIRGSSSLSSQSALIGDLLANARLYAISRNTYVYFAIGETSAGSVKLQMFVVTLASLTGSRIDPSLASSYTVLKKNTRLFDNLKLDSVSDFGGNLDRPQGARVLDTAQDQSSVSFTFSNPARETGIQVSGALTANRVIEFDPRGVARYSKGSASQPQLFKYYEIPIKQNVGNEKNLSVIQMDGVSGMVTSYRP
jgi:type II secretory pathway pseudopilin PulG